jgi:hypothetical protein
MMYTPIIRTKLGELIAFSKIGLPVAAHMRPIFELRLTGAGEAETGIESRIDKLSKNLRKAWQWSTPCALDFSHFASSLDVCVALYKAFKEQGQAVIPVITPGGTEPYMKFSSSVAEEMGHGLCFRLPVKEERPPLHELNAMRVATKIEPEAVDLVLDMGANTELPAWLLTQGIAGFISSLPELARFRSFALASTSAPRNMGEYRRDSITPVSRREWPLWKAICSQPGLVRCPDFGDYTATYPEDVVFDTKMTLGGKIRYTAENNWLIVKGGAISGKRGATSYGFEQFRILSRQLMKQPEFRGKDFSWGDAFIHACAEGTGSLGNLRTWVSVAVNQHVTFVVRQLATLAAS